MLAELPKHLANDWPGIAIHDPIGKTSPTVSITVPFDTILRRVKSPEGVPNAFKRCSTAVLNALEMVVSKRA